MKNINKFLAAGITLFAVILICISCGDDHDFNKYDSPVDPNSAKLKYIHTAVGPNGVNFTTNFSIANQKISAVNIIAGLPLGIGFGNTYPIPLNYALVPSGSQSMNVVIPARAAVASPATVAFPETPVCTATLVTEAGKNYSSFLVGMSPEYAVHTIADDFSFVNPNATTAFIRFINLITNTPAPGYEVVISKTIPAPIVILRTFSAVQYLGGSPEFVSLPTIADNDSVPYTVQLRVTGTTVVVATLTNFVPRPGRTYTFFCRGRVGGLANGLPSTTVNIPVLAFYTNR